MTEFNVFIDSSFLLVQACAHARTRLGLDARRRLTVGFGSFRRFLQRHGRVRRMVLAGAEMPLQSMHSAQLAGYEVLNLPRLPGVRTGGRSDRSVESALGWEIARTGLDQPPRGGTMVLCGGEREYLVLVPRLAAMGWDVETWLWHGAFSSAYAEQASACGTVRVLDEEWVDIVHPGSGG